MKYELRFVIEADNEDDAQDTLSALYAEIDNEIHTSECRLIEEHGD